MMCAGVYGAEEQLALSLYIHMIQHSVLCVYTAGTIRGIVKHLRVEGNDLYKFNWRTWCSTKRSVASGTVNVYCGKSR